MTAKNVGSYCNISADDTDGVVNLSILSSKYEAPNERFKLNLTDLFIMTKLKLKTIAG